MTLAVLGMANSVAGWYGKEKASIERIGNEFGALMLHGLAATGRHPRRGRVLAG